MLQVKGVSNKPFLQLIDAPINVLETLIYRCLWFFVFNGDL